MKIFAACMIAVVLCASLPAYARADNSTTLHKAFRGFFMQLNLGRLPMFNLVMAFTSGGAFFYFIDSASDPRLYCATGTYTMDAAGVLAAVLQDESYRVEASFIVLGELLIGFGQVRAVAPEDADFIWPFPLYRFIYAGMHTAAADSSMKEFSTACGWDATAQARPCRGLRAGHPTVKRAAAGRYRQCR